MPESKEFLALILFGLLGLFLCMGLLGLSVGVENANTARKREMIKNRKRMEYFVRICLFSETSYREQRRERQEELIESLGLSVFDAEEQSKLPSYEEATESCFEKLPSYKEALVLQDSSCKPPEYECV